MGFGGRTSGCTVSVDKAADSTMVGGMAWVIKGLLLALAAALLTAVLAPRSSVVEEVGLKVLSAIGLVILAVVVVGVLAS